MTAGAPHAAEDETAQALQALMADPKATRLAIRILREEFQTARGLERRALALTIVMLERRAAESA